MFDTTAPSCRLMFVIVPISLCIVNIARPCVKRSSMVMQCHVYVCVCVCVCRRMGTVIGTHVCIRTVNVVVEWRQLAAICVNVYVQVRV